MNTNDSLDFRAAIANKANKLYGCTAIPADKPNELMIGYVVYKEVDGKEIVAYPLKKLYEFTSHSSNIFHDELLALIKTGADEVNQKIMDLEKET